MRNDYGIRPRSKMMKGGSLKGGSLKGGQKKLDANKDGKISGDDFAMLRNKKSINKKSKK